MSILEKLERAIDKRALGETQFREQLKRLGLKPGAVVMVHASMTEIVRRMAGMTASAVTDLIRDLVSPGGTILAPAFESETIANAFRALPGALTSIHPTHPVIAWGKHARALTATHHFGGTFDTFSPFYKVCELDGIVVGIGMGLEKFSILHVAEELHEALRIRVFEKEVRTINLMENNESFEYAYRALRSEVYRDYDTLEKVLLKSGTLRHSNESGLHCAVLAAKAFLCQSKDLTVVGQLPQSGK